MEGSSSGLLTAVDSNPFPVPNGSKAYSTSASAINSNMHNRPHRGGIR